MLTIYKYPFHVGDRVEIVMPRYARILKVEAQDGVACLWALVETGQPARVYRFLIFGTGHAIDRDGSPIGPHVATFQMPPFVWRVFKVAGEPS